MHNLFDGKSTTTTTAIATMAMTAATGVKTITNIIGSDQEELVDNSFSDEDDDDDDDDDDDGMDEHIRDEIDMLSDGIPLDCDDTEDLVSISLVKSSSTTMDKKKKKKNSEIQQKNEHDFEYCRRHRMYHQSCTKHYQNALKESRKSFIRLIAYGLGLMITSFGLIVLLPLHQYQLDKQLPFDKNNSFGTILFISPIVMMILIIILFILTSSSSGSSSLSTMSFKWNWHIFRFPSSIPIKRLIIISTIFGLSSAIILMCRQRVACHLQDPIKGTALAFALLFYFVLCKRVMGLKKIFAATTIVIGLFISMDYGLCDEFHCHGNVISYKERIKSTGWQGRSFWALAYTIGIFFWTLHLSLLEECFVRDNGEKELASNENNFLTTISKFVANTDSTNDRDKLIADENSQLSAKDIQETTTTSTHPLHIAMWVHLIGTIVTILIGSIDVLPVNGNEIKSFAQHWKETKLTFACNLGIGDENEKRNANSELLNDQRMPNELDNIKIENYQIHQLQHKTNHHNNHFMSIHNENHHRNKTQARKKIINFQNISHSNAFQKYKNATSNHMPSMSGKLDNVGHKKNKLDCSHNGSFYIWLLICTYAGFVVCLFNFLNITKSAVFTVAMTTAILPFIGLFWSFFRLETQHSSNAVIVWSPSVSGELICSVLGIPIVFVGIIVLYKSHYNDTTNSLTNKPFMSCDA